MELQNRYCVFLAMIAMLQGAKALTCSSDTLKITIKTLPDEYEFDEYEQYEMKATIAYSVQKYCGETKPPPCIGITATPIASDVTISDITERISMCVTVNSFNSDTVRQAIRTSKANLNGALLLTDDDLYVDGILPTLPPVPTYDFEPWLIAYIVVACLIVLGGVAVVLYTKFHKSEKPENEELLAEDDEMTGKTNNAYEESGRVYEVIAEVGQIENAAPPSELEERSSHGSHDEENAAQTIRETEEATAL